jgi:hypothetical protein
MSARRYLSVLGILLVAGQLRLAPEQALHDRLQREGLASPPIEVGLQERIGQTSMAVALGGLRTLVATFTNLRITEAFRETRWLDLEKVLETTVELSPHTEYYWDMGSWHLAYNAASSAGDVSDLDNAPRDLRRKSEILRRRAEWKRWVLKGRAFLERGLRFNPEDPSILVDLGRVYSDPFRMPDDKKAADFYGRALKAGEDRPYIRRAYLAALASSGDQPILVQSMLYQLLQDPKNRVPVLLCLQYVLERGAEPPEKAVENAVRIFGSKDKALRNLGAYYTNVRMRLPLDGVEVIIRLLERDAGISPDSPKSYIAERERALMNVEMLGR